MRSSTKYGMCEESRAAPMLAGRLSLRAASAPGTPRSRNGETLPRDPDPRSVCVRSERTQNNLVLSGTSLNFQRSAREHRSRLYKVGRACALLCAWVWQSGLFSFSRDLVRTGGVPSWGSFHADRWQQASSLLGRLSKVSARLETAAAWGYSRASGGPTRLNRPFAPDLARTDMPAQFARQGAGAKPLRRSSNDSFLARVSRLAERRARATGLPAVVRCGETPPGCNVLRGHIMAASSSWRLIFAKCFSFWAARSAWAGCLHSHVLSGGELVSKRSARAAVQAALEFFISRNWAAIRPPLPLAGSLRDVQRELSSEHREMADGEQTAEGRCSA